MSLGDELIDQNVLFHTNTWTEMRGVRCVIKCVIDDALLKTMLDIDQVLLRLINDFNLVDPLLHFSPFLPSGMYTISYSTFCKACSISSFTVKTIQNYFKKSVKISLSYNT